jgi:hypothetical protein
VVPSVFRRSRLAAALNVAAIGFALAAVTATLLCDMGRPLVVAGTTLLVGWPWAALSRTRRAAGKRLFRGGWWFASAALAMFNAGLAAGLGGRVAPTDVASGFFIGATYGVIVWGPALAATIICFGIPIARAQRLASKGLAGEDKGERLVGAVSVAVSVLGLALSVALSNALSAKSAARSHATGAPDTLPTERLEIWFVQGCGALGLCAGATAVGLALVREGRRRRFVRRAEAGLIPDYEVRSSRDAKLLIRVARQGEGYRLGEAREEVCELDEAGAATHSHVATDGRRIGPT